MITQRLVPCKRNAMIQSNRLTRLCAGTAQEAAPKTPVYISRRGLLASIALAPLAAQLSKSSSAAAAVKPAEPLITADLAAAEPACASCVGYVDGTLGSCSAVDLPCSSSYDDRPAHFVAPWQYDGSTQAAMQQLTDTLHTFGARIEQQTLDYVYAVLDQAPGTGLDLEFVFAANDTTVALRAAQHSSADTSSSIGPDPAQAAFQLPVNAVSSLLSQIGFSRDQPSQILEDLRLQLGWEAVPILRNRQRLLFFGESPFDSFGPVPPPVPDYDRDLMDF